jgi:hypothetical protein
MNFVTSVLVLVLGLCGAPTVSFSLARGSVLHPLHALPFFVAALLVGLSLRMANTWEKFVILRAGKLQAVKR